MAEIDKATVPAKLTRFELLIEDLEKGCPSDMDAHTLMHEARQVILDLLGMSDLPPGESAYQAYIARLKREWPSEDRPTLESTVWFLKRWVPDTFPVDEHGKIHFGRALIESAIDAMEHRIEKDKDDAATQAG